VSNGFAVSLTLASESDSTTIISEFTATDQWSRIDYFPGAVWPGDDFASSLHPVVQLAFFWARHIVCCILRAMSSTVTG